MDKKTLEWMAERVEKGKVICDKISRLRALLDDLTKDSNYWCKISFRSNAGYERQINRDICTTNEIYDLFSPAIASVIKDKIAELEAEFAKL